MPRHLRGVRPRRRRFYGCSMARACHEIASGPGQNCAVLMLTIAVFEKFWQATPIFGVIAVWSFWPPCFFLGDDRRGHVFKFTTVPSGAEAMNTRKML